MSSDASDSSMLPQASCPWKRNVPADEPILSLVEIMSEELAHSLVEEDERHEEGVLRNYAIAHTGKEYDNDEEFARALQREFDREYELAETLQADELKGTKTVVMTPDRYCPKTRQQHESDDSSDEEDDDEVREAATSMLYDKLEEAHTPSSLTRDEHGELVSKHDPTVSGMRNADKAYNYDIGMKVGDMSSAQLNNKVYNSLRSFAKTDAKRHQRYMDQDKGERATTETSVDTNTRLLLFKLMNQEVFQRIDGVIATGKESAVLSAIKRTQGVTEHFAAKVFKMSLTEFKNRGEYVKDDFRFKNPRRVVKIWAEREFLNLKRMSNLNLPCPNPICVKKNVLVMSLIGEGGSAAPRLKNIDWDFFTDEERFDVFRQVFNIMTRLYKECRLVHADLSEFNLLMCAGRVYVIDVSQSMDISHPRHLYYLSRDVNNVHSFFTNIGVPNLPSRAEMFNNITDLSMNENEDLLVQVEQFERENRGLERREDKHRPADMELRIYRSECGRGESPARKYN